LLTSNNRQVGANLDEAEVRVLHVLFPEPPSLNSLDSQPHRERRKTKPAAADTPQPNPSQKQQTNKEEKQTSPRENLQPT
jgi:hypothetical protein